MKQSLKWLIKELRKTERSQKTGVLRVEGLGGISFTWGAPVHAWTFAREGEGDLSVPRTGLPALTAIIDAFAAGEAEAKWDQGKTELGDSSIFGTTISSLIELCQSSLPDSPDVAVLPHETRKTTSPRLSLDRFPICPSGDEVVLSKLPVSNVNWMSILESVIDRPAIAYYQAEDAQAVVIMERGAIVDGLWIGLEEEALIGREAMGALTNATEGNCTVMKISPSCTWVLPMIWRIPVRWDTLPLDCIEPGRTLRFLADLQGSTLCIVENDQDAWVLGIRDGWVHCMWSETNRAPRVDQQELVNLWKVHGGFLTIHRTMEPIQNLPVHPGTLVTDPQTTISPIAPVSLSNLIETITGEETAPPLFGAFEPDQSEFTATQDGDEQVSERDERTSEALAYLTTSWIRAIDQFVPEHAEMAALVEQTVGRLTPSTAKEEYMFQIADFIIEQSRTLDIEVDEAGFSLSLRRIISETMFMLDTEEEFWQLQSSQEEVTPYSTSGVERQIEIWNPDENWGQDSAAEAQPHDYTPASTEDTFESGLLEPEDLAGIPAVPPGAAAPASVSFDEITLDQLLTPTDELPSTLTPTSPEATADQEPETTMPEEVTAWIDDLLTRYRVDTNLRQSLVSSLRYRPCAKDTATWLCLQVASNMDIMDDDLESGIRLAIAAYAS
jgi:hypothetical protein